jgi:hypothetical protein
MKTVQAGLDTPGSSNDAKHEISPSPTTRNTYNS